jgi:hypothetical protein
LRATTDVIAIPPESCIQWIWSLSLIKMISDASPKILNLWYDIQSMHANKMIFKGHS